MPTATSQGRDWQIVIFMFFAALLTVLGAIGALCNLSHHALRLLWGFTSNAILLVGGRMSADVEGSMSVPTYHSARHRKPLRKQGLHG